jgi:glycine cleavage system H protein
MSADLNEYGQGSFWFSCDDTGVTIGVTGAAIAPLGSIQSIEFAEVGDEFKEGDWIAEIIGSEGKLEVLAPEALVIEERNSEVTAEPGYLEDDPTGDGWLIRGRRPG